MLLHLNEGFEEQARQQGMGAHLTQLQEAIRCHGTRALAAKGRLMAPAFYLFRWGNHRVFGRVYEDHGVSVVHLGAIVRRGDERRYQALYAAAGRQDPDGVLDFPTAEDMSSWIEQRIVDPPSLPPPLPTEYQGWLSAPGDAARCDAAVYESEFWVDAFRRRDIGPFWSDYRRLVERVVSDAFPGVPIPDWPGTFLLPDDRGRWVVWSQVYPVDGVQYPAVLLHTALPHGTSVEDAARLAEELLPETHPAPADNPQADITLEMIARKAWRSYPAYLVLDDILWAQIQENTEANLALSAQEEQLLSQVCQPAGGAPALPLFINGRAGSGKSTMLWHLFAAYCRRQAKHEDMMQGRPIFLTYSDRLVDAAREGTEQLLRAHADYLADPVELPPDFVQRFCSFRDFVRSLLSPDAQEDFPDELYVDYARFARLMSRRSLSSEEQHWVFQAGRRGSLPPALCWHVIRAYIKGYDADEYMTPDYYEEIPGADRSVTLERFQDIFSRVWDHWYEGVQTQHGLWDDQDLVREALRTIRENTLPAYPAIFCDEAQDFTRLELRLLLDASVYPRYSLSRENQLGIPFIFAGDPFQTVSPTGFRWESTRAAFHEELVSPLDPVQQRRIRLNLQELTQNYRSTAEIVKLANLVQLWRRLHSPSMRVSPQQPWRTLGPERPQLFIIDEETDTEQFAQLARNTPIVISAEENEVRQYLDDSDGPKREPLRQMRAATGSTKNIWTAVAVKGLEFDRVIVYNFGEDSPEGLFTRELSEEEALPLQYFLNKLYVAVTRARKQLIIVDTPNGCSRLWSHATPEGLKTLRDHIDDWDIWRDQIGTPTAGDDTGAFQEEDPHAIAQELEERGSQGRDADLMERAGAYYLEAGNTRQASVCQARALEFGRLHREAAEAYGRLGMFRDEWRCLWEGACWPELHRFHSDHPAEMSGHDSISLSAFMLSPNGDTTALDAFAEYLATRRDTADHVPARQPQWSHAVRAYAERLSKLEYGELTPVQWQRVADALAYLQACGHKVADDTVLRTTGHARGYPEGLDELLKLSVGVGDALLAVWEAAGGLDKARDRRWLVQLAPALETRKRYWLAFQVYMALGDHRDEAAEAFARGRRETAAKEMTPEGRQSALVGLQELMQAFWAAGDYPAAMALFLQHSPHVKASETDMLELRCGLIKLLSRFGHFLETDKKQFRELLDNVVRQGPTVWRQHLIPLELGAAMEATESIVESLRLYDRLLEAVPDSERQALRERWVVCKKRHLHYAREIQRESPERLARIEDELRIRARQWGLDPDQERPMLPELGAPAEGPAEGPRILGIADDEIQLLPAGSIRFMLGSLEVTCHEAAQRVMITDTDDLRSLSVDLANGRVSGNLVRSGSERHAGLVVIPMRGRGRMLELGTDRSSHSLLIKCEHREVSLLLSRRTSRDPRNGVSRER